MSLELIISSKNKEVTSALLEDKRLIEIHKEEEEEKTFASGDIFLGKVKRVHTGLNAAFVEVGYEKDAFLHYSDLGSTYESFKNHTKLAINGQVPKKLSIKKEIDKDGKIKDVVSQGQLMVVQVTKEPISAKGPKITTEITLPGRYLVLVPFSDKVSISQKIEDKDERKRLARLIESIKPSGFGVIIRTVALDKKVAQLNEDLSDLVDKWNSIFDNLKNTRPPKKIYGEMSKAGTIIRDMLNNNFSSIAVNDQLIYNQLLEYIKKKAPDKKRILKFYKGKLDIFQEYGIHRQIKGAFGRKVNLPGGGYLIIDHAEAMHVIDVNSGNRKGKEVDHETNVLNVNAEAAKEIARLLRLRDMGGIIAVDFIDMYESGNNQKLYEVLKKAMSKDRAKHNLIPPSKFGVVEITRQRIKPETAIETSETCPTCHGTGKVQATILVTDQIRNAIENVDKSNGIVLQVHPFLEAYFKKGIISRQVKWFFNYKKWIKIVGVTSKDLLDYKIFDKSGEQIA